VNLRKSVLSLLSIVLFGQLTVAAEATPLAQTKLDQFTYTQRLSSENRKRALVDFKEIRVNFKLHQLSLVRRSSVYGSLDPGIDLRRISRHVTITPQIERWLIAELEREHAFDLKSDPPQEQHNIMHWWCTALWTAKQKLPRDPFQDGSSETLVFEEPGKPKHSVVFTSPFDSRARLMLRQTMANLLQHVGLDSKGTPDEVATEEGDQMAPIPTDLKDLLKDADSYKGKRVSVSGWPVADGSVCIGISPKKSARAADSKYLAIDHYVSSFANEANIKPELNSRLSVDGVISGWSEATHPLLVRATRIEPEVSH